MFAEGPKWRWLVVVSPNTGVVSVSKDEIRPQIRLLQD